MISKLSKIVATGLILPVVSGLLLWFFTSSTSISLELPSFATHYRLNLRIPRTWKPDLSLFQPEDQRFRKLNLKNALKHGAIVTGIDDKYRLLLGSSEPGTAVIHYFPNKEGLPLHQFADKFCCKSRPGDTIEDIRSLRRTKRVLQTRSTKAYIIENIYLWRKGYGGVCVISITADKSDSPRMTRAKRELLFSAYLE